MKPGRKALIQLSEGVDFRSSANYIKLVFRDLHFPGLCPFSFLLHPLFGYFGYSIEKRLYKKLTLCCTLIKYITWEKEEVKAMNPWSFENNSDST